MITQLAVSRGARVVVVGRRPAALDVARRFGASAAVSGHERDLAGLLGELSPRGEGFAAVVEAVGRPETSQAAIAAVRKGGLVNLFGGCAAGAELVVDLQRFHYQELRLVATFHHTPAAIRQAFALIVEGSIDPDAYVTDVTTLRGLPAALAEMIAGQRFLKTVITPV
jgi:L-iditol 2-dehydrogenase